VKPWQWDPTKWAIWTLSKLGLVSDLREVPAEKIVMAELREAQKHAQEHIAIVAKSGQDLCPALRAAYAKLEEISISLGEGYRELESAAGEKMELSRQNLAKWRRQAAEAHEHFVLMRDLQAGIA
jgi:stearoyl-CoA desaturase (delta-9 desaturase)